MAETRKRVRQASGKATRETKQVDRDNEVKASISALRDPKAREEALDREFAVQDSITKKVRQRGLVRRKEARKLAQAAKEAFRDFDPAPLPKAIKKGKTFVPSDRDTSEILESVMREDVRAMSELNRKSGPSLQLTLSEAINLGMIPDENDNLQVNIDDPDAVTKFHEGILKLLRRKTAQGQFFARPLLERCEAQIKAATELEKALSDAEPEPEPEPEPESGPTEAPPDDPLIEDIIQGQMAHLTSPEEALNL